MTHSHDSRPRKILFGTENLGKFEEARGFVAQYGITFVSPQDLRGSPIVNGDSAPRVVEGRCSYFENSLAKAKAYQRWSGLPSLGDDTGLEVDALGGAPGIISARYAGEGCDMEANRTKLLTQLRGIRDRRARFRATLVLHVNADRFLATQGVLEGEIAEHVQGNGGFGYDSLFVVAELGLTLAELKAGRQQVLTHRLQALERLVAQLDSRLMALQ